MSSPNLLVIVAPTASGKTALAVKLARELKGEIISADSRQVYRGLDIGSGKDLDEYKEVPYHLIDIVEPGYEYSVFDYQQKFYQTFNDIQQRSKLPILAGGSALYVDSVINGYRMLSVDTNLELREQLAHLTTGQLATRLLTLKPTQHNSTDLIEPERIIRAIEIAEAEKENISSLPDLPEIRPIIFAIKWSREITRQRITHRLKQRLENGMIEEVASLQAGGVKWETLEFYGLEYRFIAQYLQQKSSYNDLFQKLNSAIHQFAKKQDTWLRRLERKGHQLNWLEGSEDITAQALEIYQQNYQQNYQQ